MQFKSGFLGPPRVRKNSRRRCATTLIELAVVTALASILLFTLVVARMAGLVRQQERSVARERVLGAAGAALVAARSQGEIARAALDSVGPLLEGPGQALLCLRDERGLSVAVAEGGPRDACLSDATAYSLLELAAATDGRDGAALSEPARAELGLS